MPHGPAQPPARDGEGPVDAVGARIAANDRLLQRSRRRAAQAMAQVRYIDRLLHSGSPPSVVPEQAEGARSQHLTEVMEHELAAHLRAAALHEQAAELQEEWGWPERAAAARAHAAHAPLPPASPLTAADGCVETGGRPARDR
jgi:hypothetical protein